MANEADRTGAVHINGEWATAVRYQATTNKAGTVDLQLQFMKGRREVASTRVPSPEARELLGEANHARIDKALADRPRDAEGNAKAQGQLRGKELDFVNRDLAGFVPGQASELTAATGIRESLLKARMETDNVATLPIPKNDMSPAEALQLARQDARDFAQIHDPKLRVEAALVVAHHADNQSAYRTEFARIDQRALRETEVVAPWYIAQLKSREAAGEAPARFTSKDYITGLARAAATVDLQDAQGQEPTLRFAVQRVDSKGKVVSQQTTNSPIEAMRGFADFARPDFGRDLGRGSHVALTDAQSKLDAAKTYEGFSVYNTRFATEEGRQTFEALVPSPPGLEYPVDRPTRSTLTQDRNAAVGVGAEPSAQDSMQPNQRGAPHQHKGGPVPAEPQARRAEPTQSPSPTMNSLDFVSSRELQPDSPEVAQLRRQAMESRSRSELGGSESNSAATAPQSREQESQALETIARMNAPELKALVDAARASPTAADEVLSKAESRIAAEANRPRAFKPIPPLEERFNIKSRLFARDYEFRDQPGKVAFTERLTSMQSTVDRPAVVKAMVERAEERGWTTLRVSGSPEFERQAWIAATARGIKAVGYEPTEGDRLAAREELDRLGKERGQAQVLHGGAITREATRARDVPAWAGPPERPTSGAQPRSSPPTKSSELDQRAESDRPVAIPMRSYLAERGERTQNAEAIVALANKQLQRDRVYVGTVVASGADHFDFDQKNDRSPYVKLQTPDGEKIVWGVDLPRALEEGKIKVGDGIALEHRGMQPVTVVVKDHDGSGQVVGDHEEVVKRNSWFAVKVDQLRDEALGRHLTTQRPPSLVPSAERASTVDASARSSPIAAVATTQARTQRPHGRDAMIFEALEAAFEAKNVPAPLRDGLRENVRKELDQRYSRGQAVGVKVYDPAATRQTTRAFKAPKRQRDEHDRAR